MKHSFKDAASLKTRDFTNRLQRSECLALQQFMGTQLKTDLSWNSVLLKFNYRRANGCPAFIAAKPRGFISFSSNKQRDLTASTGSLLFQVVQNFFLWNSPPPSCLTAHFPRVTYFPPPFTTVLSKDKLTHFLLKPSHRREATLWPLLATACKLSLERHCPWMHWPRIYRKKIAWIHYLFCCLADQLCVFAFQTLT